MGGRGRGLGRGRGSARVREYVWATERNGGVTWKSARIAWRWTKRFQSFMKAFSLTVTSSNSSISPSACPPHHDNTLFSALCMPQKTGARREVGAIEERASEKGQEKEGGKGRTRATGRGKRELCELKLYIGRLPTIIIDYRQSLSSTVRLL